MLPPFVADRRRAETHHIAFQTKVAEMIGAELQRRSGNRGGRDFCEQAARLIEYAASGGASDNRQHDVLGGSNGVRGRHAEIVGNEPDAERRRVFERLNTSHVDTMAS